MKQKKFVPPADDGLYLDAEQSANRFNLVVLTVMCFLIILTEILNELGAFRVEKYVLRPCAAVCVLLFATPVVWHLLHDVVKKIEPRLIEQSWFKLFLIAMTFLGYMLICVTMTHQAVILLVIPSLMTAQYRFHKRQFIVILIASALLVPLSVYGGFFFGTPDRNLLKGLSDAEAATLAGRIAAATPKRMAELSYHYVLPRMFCVTAVYVLASGIARRNGRMLARQAALTEQVREEMERRSTMQNRVIEDLAAVIETRDEGTGEHVLRTKKYVGMIAKLLQQDDAFRDRLTGEDVNEICNAAPLHDVGKIAVSDSILLKPGRLTPEEFDKIKIHTTKGGKMIRHIFSNLEGGDFLKRAEEIAVSHHEKWNGKGYPEGLAGEDIPLSARIMAVADVFDALVSERVYKAAIPPEEALDIIVHDAGTHFDPEIVRIVNAHRDEFIQAAKSPV